MPAAIVFDLDGTVVDSAPDLRIALSAVLAAEGVEGVTLAQTRDFIGHGIPDLVRQAREARGIAPERQGPMLAAMLETYLRAPAENTRLYPGARESLAALAAAGHPLGLCTNKALAPTEAILARLGLGGVFAVVIGGDSLPQKKPDPAPLHAAFAALGRPLLYVGDSEVDAQTARAAGVRFALHTEGYRKTPPGGIAHDFAFADFAALAPYVGRLSDGLS